MPGEDGTVDYFDVFCVAARGGGQGELRGLEGGEGGGYFDDFEFCAGVDFRVDIADVVEDIEHEGAVSGPQFVDYEVVVGVVG